MLCMDALAAVGVAARKIEREFNGCKYKFEEKSNGYEREYRCEGKPFRGGKSSYKTEEAGCKYEYEEDESGYKEKQDCKRERRGAVVVPGPLEHLPHRVWVPGTAPRRRDRPVVELRRDCPQRPGARGPDPQSHPLSAQPVAQRVGDRRERGLRLVRLPDQLGDGAGQGQRGSLIRDHEGFLLARRSRPR